MEFKITAKQVARFLYTALIMQIAVYFIIGLICKYRYTFSMIQFSYGLSYAGLGLLVISGIIFITARPKTRRPGTPQKTDAETERNSDKEESEKTQGTIDFNFLSPIKSLFGLSAMMSGNTPKTDKTSPKFTQKQLYYYSGLFFLVGMTTILSSEIIYRGLQNSMN